MANSNPCVLGRLPPELPIIALRVDLPAGGGQDKYASAVTAITDNPPRLCVGILQFLVGRGGLMQRNPTPTRLKRDPAQVRDGKRRVFRLHWYAIEEPRPHGKCRFTGPRMVVGFVLISAQEPK